MTVAGKTIKAPPQIGHFGRRYLIIKMRQRITIDGGASILALNT